MTYNKATEKFFIDNDFLYDGYGVIKSKNSDNNKYVYNYPGENAIEIHHISKQAAKWLNPRNFFLFCIDDYTPMIEEEVLIMNHLINSNLDFLKERGGIVKKQNLNEFALILSLSSAICFSLIFCWNSYFFSDTESETRRIETKDGTINFTGNLESLANINIS